MVILYGVAPISHTAAENKVEINDQLLHEASRLFGQGIIKAKELRLCEYTDTVE